MHIFLIILIPFLSLFSQEEEITVEKPKTVSWRKPENDKNPSLAALLGFFPGLGQAYLGNIPAAGVQAGLFLGITGARSEFASRPDYIEYDNREVKFDYKDALFGYYAQRNGLVYNDDPTGALLKKGGFPEDKNIPYPPETKFGRDLRLLKEGQLGELNPYLKYGDYTRTSRNTVYADMLSNPMLSVMFYSIYSSYRDAGGLGEEKKKETFADIAYAPFNIDVLKKPLVFIPILAIAALTGLSESTPDGSNPILGPKSVKTDGSLHLSAFVGGISPAIGEEAFFRGYLNENMIRRYGNVPGIGLSSLFFMLAHEGNNDASDGRVSRFLAGAYLGYLHSISGFDIRPGSAVHFWYNFILGLAEISRYKADENYSKSQKEVYYMPLQYSLRF